MSSTIIQVKVSENNHIHTLNIEYGYQNNKKDIYLLNDSHYFFVQDSKNPNIPLHKKGSFSELLYNLTASIDISTSGMYISTSGMKLTKNDRLKKIKLLILSTEKDKLLSNNSGDTFISYINDDNYEEEWSILSLEEIKQKICLDKIYNLT